MLSRQFCTQVSWQDVPWGRYAVIAAKLSLILLICAIGFGIPMTTPIAQAQDETVNIRMVIKSVTNIVNTENFPDTGTADYYADQVLIDSRSQPRTDVIWDQDTIEPHWQWVETFTPGTLSALAPSQYSATFEFGVWDDDEFGDTEIILSGSAGPRVIGSVVFNDSNCWVESLGSGASTPVLPYPGYAADSWEYGVCRMDLVTQGTVGDRASVEFSLILTRAPREALIPLYEWYSPDRADNAAYTSEIWAGEAGDVRSPDYRFGRADVLVFNPALPQPSGTVPLYRWWSPSRGDNFTTADPAWAGFPGDPDRDPDYQARGIIGYIYPEEGPNRVPLHSWYDPDRGDNFITGQPDWYGFSGDTRAPNYGWSRLEGYGVGPEAEEPAEEGAFTGRFTGTVNGADGSSALVTLDVSQSGNAVTGNLRINPGLRIDTGCFLGIRSIPARTFMVDTSTTSDAPNRLPITVPVTVDGAEIILEITAILSEDGETIEVTVVIDFPEWLEFFGCSDQTITVTLTRS